MNRIRERMHLLGYQVKCKAQNKLQDFYTTSIKQNEDQIINQKEIRIAGLKRTGNHAIICWLKEQQKAQGITYHLNAIKN